MVQSFEQIDRLLLDALQKTGAYKYPWLVEVYPDSVVYRSDGETKTWKRSYAIDDKDVVTLGDPTEVKEVKTYEAVKPASFTFAADGDAVDGFVEKVGKVFEAGEWPDKGFAVSEDDLDRAVAEFAPVPNDLEHRPTLLSGKLGELSEVWRDGRDLMGKVRIPAWLAKVSGDGPVQVSLAWDRAKRIVGNALTINPRISDAAVFAAFSETEATSDEQEPTIVAPETPRKGIAMELIDRIKSLFTGLTPEQRAEIGLDAAIPAPVPAPVPTFTDEAKAQIEAANARARKLEEARLETVAAEFADGAVTSGKVSPAERDALVSLFTTLAKSAAGDAVLFTDSGELAAGEAVETLKAFVEARPAIKWTTDGAKFAVPAAGSDATDEPMSKKRKKELLVAAGRSDLAKEID